MLLGDVAAYAPDALRASLRRVATLQRNQTLGRGVLAVHRSGNSAVGVRYSPHTGNTPSQAVGRAVSLPRSRTLFGMSMRRQGTAARQSASADQLEPGRADSFVALAAFHPDIAGG
jgi:hypothetical protein